MNGVTKNGCDEPAHQNPRVRLKPETTSGFEIGCRIEVLIHDRLDEAHDDAV